MAMSSRAAGRIAAVEAAYSALLGADAAKAMTGRIWTVADVRLHEAIVAKLSPGQGCSSDGPRISDDEWSRMDAGERLAYARSHSNGAR
jgi:hypothetical protein